MKKLIHDINIYNQSKKFEDFEKIGDKYIFYVDWREFDDDIVEYCENIINTGSLNGEITDDNILSVNYKGNNFKVEVTKSRDTTLKFLNKILLPDYEIRFCTITFPSDTLGFILLSSAEWKAIEEEIPRPELDKIFEPIHENSKMFDRDYDF